MRDVAGIFSLAYFKLHGLKVLSPQSLPNCARVSNLKRKKKW